MPPRVRACKDCGQPFAGSGSRCPEHGGFRGFPRAQRQANPIYRDPRWTRLSTRVIREWVAEHGWVCPGWHRPSHPSQRLSADHVRGLAQGGSPFDRANVAVLCLACNAAKGLAQRHLR